MTDLKRNELELNAALNDFLNLKVSNIQIFKEGGSANIAFNNKYLLQLGTDNEFSIPNSNEMVWSTKEEQDLFCQIVNVKSLVDYFSIPNSIDELEEYAQKDADCSLEIL